LPYAFASHFAPRFMHEAIRVYRNHFQPSEVLDKPYVMLGVLWRRPKLMSRPNTW
jgi:hypothetical protein